MRRKLRQYKKMPTLNSTFLSWYLKWVLTMAPPVGLEPTTHGLTVRRSTDWAKGEYLCWHYLSSRQVTLQVLWARVSLTSVFGMGTGGPSPQSTPTRTRFAGNSVLKNAFSVQTEVWHFPYSVRQSVRNRTPDSDTPWKLNTNEWGTDSATEPAPSFSGQAFGLLVSVSLTPYDAYTPDLSTT